MVETRGGSWLELVLSSHFVYLSISDIEGSVQICIVEAETYQVELCISLIGKQKNNAV